MKPITFLILILIYNLHTIKNSDTFSIFPLNICSLATSILDPVCYDIVKEEVVIFFIYSSGFYIGFYFEFTFIYYINDNNEEACDTVVT